MAFVEGSKLYAVKIVNDKKVLYEVSKDDVRKAPHVDSLPEPSGSKRGLIYLYDNGEGENGYICVKSGEDEYEWLSLGGNPDEFMSKEVYDKDGSVALYGGIEGYVTNSEKSFMKILDYDPYLEVAEDGGIRQYIYNNRSDWDENNTYGSLSYIKHRPFYDSRVITKVFSTIEESRDRGDRVKISNSSSVWYAVRYTSLQKTEDYLSTGKKYEVTYGDETYIAYCSSATLMFSHDSGSTWETANGVRFIYKLTTYTDNSYALVASKLQYYPDRETNKYTYDLYLCFPVADNVTRKWNIDNIVSGELVQIPDKFVNLSSTEKIANKDTTISASSTDDNYPSSKAVYDFVTQNSSSVGLGTITLGTTWTGSDPYSQIVTVSGATVTKNSKVDIQIDGGAFAQFTADGVKYLYIANINGALYAFMSGGPLTDSVTVNCTVTLVNKTAQTTLYSNPIIL